MLKLREKKSSRGRKKDVRIKSGGEFISPKGAACGWKKERDEDMESLPMRAALMRSFINRIEKKGGVRGSAGAARGEAQKGEEVCVGKRWLHPRSRNSRFYDLFEKAVAKSPSDLNRQKQKKTSQGARAYGKGKELRAGTAICRNHRRT